jgi:hypothetical protein
VKALTKIIFAFAFALSVAAPAFAQSSGYGYRMSAGQQMNRPQPGTVKRARNAFDMGSGSKNAFNMKSEFGFQIDANSPAATGGGSLGYNQKLLDD